MGRATRTASGFGVLVLVSACSHEAPRVAIESPFSENTTVAVAPILNFSGEFDLDPVKAADLLASELSYVKGLTVLPVNRVIAYIATEGKEQVESPAHALAIADAIGADVILVAGITEYDPYTPVVGLALQMYRSPTRDRPALDPVSASRQASVEVVSQMADMLSPTGQVQFVCNGSHADVVKAVRRYAVDRSEGDSPYGYQQYLKVQTLFLRFCWHEALERLMAQQRLREVHLAQAQEFPE